MLLTDKWLFGKLKGKTLEATLKCEADREWIYWYVSQPSNKPEYAERDKSQKDSLKRHLERVETGRSNPSDVSSMMYISGKIGPIEERLVKLEQRMLGMITAFNRFAPAKEQIAEKQPEEEFHKPEDDEKWAE